jgi:hypothetical protein
MSEKRMLIVDTDLLLKIDDNRGEMSRSEFIAFVLENQLNDVSPASNPDNQYVTREEYQEFALGMKDLLRRFLDFFISYGLELGQEPKDETFSELVQKLQTLSANAGKPKTAK